jgi:hypothetical protein
MKRRVILEVDVAFGPNCICHDIHGEHVCQYLNWGEQQCSFLGCNKRVVAFVKNPGGYINFTKTTECVAGCRRSPRNQRNQRQGKAYNQRSKKPTLRGQKKGAK